MRNIPALSGHPGLFLRLTLLAACFVVLTGFDACGDDPILDPAGGTQNCHPSYGCSASLAPSDSRNPERF